MSSHKQKATGRSAGSLGSLESSSPAGNRDLASLFDEGDIPARGQHHNRKQSTGLYGGSQTPSSLIKDMQRLSMSRSTMSMLRSTSKSSVTSHRSEGGVPSSSRPKERKELGHKLSSSTNLNSLGGSVGGEQLLSALERALRLLESVRNDLRETTPAACSTLVLGGGEEPHSPGLVLLVGGSADGQQATNADYDEVVAPFVAQDVSGGPRLSVGEVAAAETSLSSHLKGTKSGLLDQHASLHSHAGTSFSMHNVCHIFEERGTMEKIEEALSLLRQNNLYEVSPTELISGQQTELDSNIKDFLVHKLGLVFPTDEASELDTHTQLMTELKHIMPRTGTMYEMIPGSKNNSPRPSAKIEVTTTTVTALTERFRDSNVASPTTNSRDIDVAHARNASGSIGSGDDGCRNPAVSDGAVPEQRKASQMETDRGQGAGATTSNTPPLENGVAKEKASATQEVTTLPGSPARRADLHPAHCDDEFWEDFKVALGDPVAASVTEIMDRTWPDFDALELSELVDNRPLFVVFQWLLMRENLLSTLNIDPETLQNVADVLDKGYRMNPYHNAAHAADVTFSVHHLLCSNESLWLLGQLSQDEVFAALLAAAIHDFDHPGLSNQFLIESNDKLAVLYNDRSPLENHHLAAAFELILSHENNIFRAIEKVRTKAIRVNVIAAVLATDLKVHFETQARFQGKLRTEDGLTRLDDPSDRQLVISTALKASATLLSFCSHSVLLFLRCSSFPYPFSVLFCMCHHLCLFLIARLVT
jgi:hypothetical protein